MSRPPFKVRRQDLATRTWSRKVAEAAARSMLREEARLTDVPCTCGAITALNPCPYCGGERPCETS